jgi:hypothetical protein
MAEGSRHRGEAAVAGEVEEVRATTRTAVLVRGTAVEAGSGDEVVLNIITCRVLFCPWHDGWFFSNDVSFVLPVAMTLKPQRPVLF